MESQRSTRNPRETQGSRSEAAPTDLTEQTRTEPHQDTTLSFMMTATFPSEIRTKEITGGFSGDPQELDSLDIQVFDLCDGNGYPAYYGGMVAGSIDERWEYVPASLGKPNYTFGRRLCSKIASTMKGNAARWWEEYCKAGHPRPNCWKLSSGAECAGTKPPTIVEVSLFELLREEFSTDDDQQSCIAELQRLK